MERRRPRKSSRHFLRSKANPSVDGEGGAGGGGSAPSTSKVVYPKSEGDEAPTITSLLGGRLNRVSRFTRVPQALQITENPEKTGVPERESVLSEGSESNPEWTVIAESASPRGSAVHGIVGIAFNNVGRDSESPRVSEELPEVFRTSSVRPSTVTSGSLRFNTSQDGHPTGNINFAPDSFSSENRNSSLVSNEGDGNVIVERTAPSLGSCPQGWVNARSQSNAGPSGRDTLGFAIQLGAATVGNNRCGLGVTCDEDCGYGNGCDAGCSEDHGIEPGSIFMPAAQNAHALTAAVKLGGPPPNSNLRGAQKPQVAYKPCPALQRESNGADFGSDPFSFFVTFLLEVLGVLVFFAICTITFWITLGYHVVQLLLDLKNADRNVQVAVGIVFGLLFVAFAISQVTNLSGSCCHAKDRARSRAKGGSGICPFHRPPKTNAKAKQKISSPKPKSCPHKAKLKKASICGAKYDLHSHRRPRYTDCEGRAIFLSSRRYAIPTEMKQPPTIVLWLRDVLARMMQ